MIFNLVFKQVNIIEPQNFLLERPEGTTRYMFFHFSTPVIITLDGKEEITSPGAVILFAPGYPQKFIPYNCRLKHDYVDFEIFDNEYIKNLHFPTNKILYPHISNTITSTISKLKNVEDENELGSKYEEDSLFSMLLLAISRKLNKKRHAHTADTNESIKRQFETLRLEMYQSPVELTVDTLANKVGFSNSYFNKIYKKLFLVSPINDLDKARIEYVKNEIFSTPLSELANKLGFASTEYFYVWFKKKTGMTPKQFIENSFL